MCCRSCVSSSSSLLAKRVEYQKGVSAEGEEEVGEGSACG